MDIQELEAMGHKITESVSNYMMNVDIMSAQFDPYLLFDEAQKLGLDIGDLKEYGFDPKGSKCSTGNCNGREFMMDLDEKINGK